MTSSSPNGRSASELERERKLIGFDDDSAQLAACVSIRDFVLADRQPLRPFVTSGDGRTVVFAAETTFVIAGTSGIAKSLTMWDLAGRLADDSPSDWLGLRVCGGLRVMLLSFEGSDEDTAERAQLLVPPGAAGRFTIWDRWRREPMPTAEACGLLIAELRRQETDVLVIDTARPFFGAGFDVDRGEEAHEVIEDLRHRSGRQLGVLLITHTKKRNGAGGPQDLEAIAGTFSRKGDAALLLSSVSNDETDLRRRVTFVKTRRGRKPAPRLVAFPSDPDAPPRLELAAEVGRPVTEGTEADAMAAWIADQLQPVAPAELTERFGVSDATLRQRRRLELEALGVTRRQVPGRGNRYAYGTDEQWARIAVVSS